MTNGFCDFTMRQKDPNLHRQMIFKQRVSALLVYAYVFSVSIWQKLFISNGRRAFSNERFLHQNDNEMLVWRKNISFDAMSEEENGMYINRIIEKEILEVSKEFACVTIYGAR